MTFKNSGPAGGVFRNHFVRPAIVGCIMCMIATSGGCNFVPKPTKLQWPWSEEKKKELPERILPVWTDSVLYQPNQPGVRGFGGRVYFYVKDGKDPVEVDGGLAVYVFDAENEQHDQKPLRKFAFTPEQFAGHMSHTSIGPSYSVWLPWGEVGGPPRKLSLIARFEGREGGTVISDPTIKLLPGVSGKKEPADDAQARSASSSPFQLTGHASAAKATSAASESGASNMDPAPTAHRNRDIGTIDLPPSFQRHLFDESKASDTKEPSSSESPAGSSSVDKGASSVDLGTPIPAVDSSTVVASPLTTEVVDYRSRMQQSAQAKHTVTGEKSKTDIRAGRWIQAPSRAERK